MTDTFFIFDFDSTFISEEGFDTLAAVALTKRPDKEIVLEKIHTLTNQGMEGQISLTESLKKRIALLSMNKTHIEKTISLLKKKITPSFLRNKAFFQQYRDNIYVISGGFKELVIPVVRQLGISEEHVFANTFLFDKEGRITGFDEEGPLSRNGGKAKVIRSLALSGEIIVIGEGITDLEASEQVEGAKFIAFTENVLRESVVKEADRVIQTLDELLYERHLPRAFSYPKSKMKVLLLENINPRAVEVFQKENYEVIHYTKSLTKDELQHELKDVHILGIRSRTQIDEEVLSFAKKLLAIGVFSIGIDKVDIRACQKKGIAVFNAPYSNTRSVAELVIGEIIMLARGVMEKNNKLHKGVWDKTAQGSYEIRGKTLGIIGYGHIGTQVSVLAESLGMKVIFYDIAEKLTYGNATQCDHLETLLRQADVVTLHVDGRKTNRQLINEQAFLQMKEGVLFINCSRGEVVDITALTKYVQNGKIQGAAIDVFPQEPKSKDEQFVSELQRFPQVILTPHIGGSTREAQENIAVFVSKKLSEFINVGTTSLNLSLPEIELPIVHGAHRLLHIHKNVPGVLAKVNTLFAAQQVNIVGQYLQTNESVGYVITDVNKQYNPEVIAQLKSIPETIRLRVLY